MKRGLILTALLSMVLAMGLLFVACENPTKDDGGGGNINDYYAGAGKLTITGLPSGSYQAYVLYSFSPTSSNINSYLTDSWEAKTLEVSAGPDFDLVSKSEGKAYTSGGFKYVLLKKGDVISYTKDQIQFAKGCAAIAWSSFTTIETLSNDIDSTLTGTWKDEPAVAGYGTPGANLTITFSGSGVTWSGTMGNAINNATQAVKNQGITSIVWVAKDGKISWVYTDPNSGKQTTPVYSYKINSAGKLELGAATGGPTLLTLVKEGSSNTQLEADIDTSLIGTWNDKTSGASYFSITFSSTGVTWSGTGKGSFDNQVNAYTKAWIAKNGKLSYDYINDGKKSYPVYDYSINGSGELVFKTSGGSTVYTLVKGSGNPPLENDIDSSLMGDWEIKQGPGISGNELTLTFASTGITWGGSYGSSLDALVGTYQSLGYPAAWVANNGKISYDYIDPYAGKQSVPMYDYSINGSGELEIKVSGYTLYTLVKEGSIQQPPLENDIDATLMGTWKDKVTGSMLTLTFTPTGVTWGGSSGSSLDALVGTYQSLGYPAAWVANNGKISYDYIDPYIGKQAVPIYDYSIDGNGELELKSGGYAFLTLAKQP